IFRGWIPYSSGAHRGRGEEIEEGRADFSEAENKTALGILPGAVLRNSRVAQLRANGQDLVDRPRGRGLREELLHAVELRHVRRVLPCGQRIHPAAGERRGLHLREALAHALEFLGQRLRELVAADRAALVEVEVA
ncbi:MAG: hypothetical protein ACK559_28770, partial [bacterium]